VLGCISPNENVLSTISSMWSSAPLLVGRHLFLELVQHELEEIEEEVVLAVVVVVQQRLALRELVPDPLDREVAVSVFTERDICR